MRKPISLLTVLILGLLASLLIGVQTAKTQQIPSEQLSVTIAPSNAITIDVGQYVQFIASVSGGAPPYSYQWYANESPMPDATSSSFTFAPNSPSTYNISVIVTDSLSTQASSNATSVTVNSWLNVRIETGSTTTYVNQPVQLTAFASGGTPPYSYQWYYQLYPNGETVAVSTYQSFMFTPTSLGTYVIGLIVTDSVNNQAGNVQLPITVTVIGTATPSPSPTPTLTPTATPTSTSTPSPSPTPTPILGESRAYTIIASGVIIITTIIAVLALLEKQRRQSIEKPKA
jgi:hypothetical protein